MSYRSKKDPDGFTMPANGYKDPLAPNNREGRHRAKKDRRRWCRGKKGVEHVTEIVMYTPSWWDQYHEEERSCFWWRGAHIWRCYHQEICTNCGKILQHTLGDDCPDKPKEE